MDNISELPLIPEYNNKDYYAGIKSARDYIAEIGLERVIQYFNTKAAYCTKFSAHSVISYWTGYRSLLISRSKKC